MAGRKRAETILPDPRFEADLLSDHELDWESSSEDEDEHMERLVGLNLITRSDIPQEYWQLQKLLKFLKAKTPNVTSIVLGCIIDLNLDTEFMQLAFREGKILQMLINIVGEPTGRNYRSKELALLLLSRVTQHVVIQHEVTCLGVIPILVDVLVDPARELQRLAATIIANVAQLKSSSKIVVDCEGIPILVHLLDLEERLLKRSKHLLSAEQVQRLEVASDAARALWALSSYEPSKQCMHEAGVIALMPRLLQAKHRDILTRTMGILQNCGNLPEFQMAIYTLDLVKDMVRLFVRSESVELRTLCALAMFKHSEDAKVRELVRVHSGLTPLARALQRDPAVETPELMTAVTGAVWKLAIDEESVRQLEAVGTIPALVRLLDVDDEGVLTHVAGALAEMSKLAHNAVVILRAGGIPPLVDFLHRTNQNLLANSARALGQCAWDAECMAEMERQDAVRLIWSLLRNPSPRVQANAAWALVPCVRNAEESGEMVRSFVGGMELLVRSLNSPDSRVVACTCAALAEVATDGENVGVVSDLGVLPVLAKLCKAAAADDDHFLQQHVAAAVAAVCHWGRNCHELGRLGAISPLVRLLYVGGEGAQSTAIQALAELSRDPFNCIALHQNRVVPMLIKAVGSTDLQKQRAAALCLANIRRLALRADKWRFTEAVRKRERHVHYNADVAVEYFRRSTVDTI